jgi:type VI secretion system protein VasG
VFCKLRGNPYVELVHWIAQILQTQDSDLHRIVRHFNIDASKLSADITAALDRLPRGATSISDLSEHIENAVERSWTYASLMFRDAQVRGGYLMVGLVKTNSLRNVLYSISKEFEKVGIDALTDALRRS